MIQATKTVEAHTVGSAVMVGDPLPTFGKGRVCKVRGCRTRLSIYNDRDVCRPCVSDALHAQRKEAARLEREREYDRRRRQEAAALDVPPRRVTREDVIAYLTEHPGSRTNQVAPALGARVQAMGLLMRKMERDGQLRREEGTTGSRQSGHRYYVKDGDA